MSAGRRTTTDLPGFNTVLIEVIPEARYLTTCSACGEKSRPGTGEMTVQWQAGHTMTHLSERGIAK